MADKNDYYEFLYAYAFGCLDNDDLIAMKQYLESNDDYYWQELGEFQNLSSLLPAILSIENPDQDVKDKVARKLYRIRNEIRAKRDKLKKENKISEDTVEEKTEPEKEEEIVVEEVAEEKWQETPAEEPEKTVEDFEIVRSPQKIVDLNDQHEEREEEEKEETEEEQTTTGIEEGPPKQVLNFDKEQGTVNANEIDTASDEKSGPAMQNFRKYRGPDIVEEERRRYGQKRLKQVEEREKKKSRLPFVIFSTVMLILMISLVFMYYKISSSVKVYEAQINSLNEQIVNLNEQFRNNRDLQSVLSSKNLKTVDLVGSDIAKNAFGKLFISLDTNHGVLQFSNVPALRKDETYQLWIYIYDNYISLGKFKPTDNLVYFPFDTPQLSENSKVNFLVTVEPVSGSSQPGDKVFLTGSF